VKSFYLTYWNELILLHFSQIKHLFIQINQILNIVYSLYYNYPIYLLKN